MTGYKTCDLYQMKRSLPGQRQNVAEERILNGGVFSFTFGNPATEKNPEPNAGILSDMLGIWTAIGFNYILVSTL